MKVEWRLHGGYSAVTGKSHGDLHKGVCGEFIGCVGFLVVFFLYKTNPNLRKIICCGKKWPKFHCQTFFFLGWVGLGLGSSTVS